MSRYTDRIEDMWEEYDLWKYQAYHSSNVNGAGHFTQMAWAKTRYISCGVNRCNDGTYWRFYLVCNYSIYFNSSTPPRDF